MLLLLGITAWGQTTYKLEQVTSVEAGSKYVFEQNGRVMNNKVEGVVLCTTDEYNRSGLTGKEPYVWTLVAESGGYYMKNCGRESKEYLSNYAEKKKTNKYRLFFESWSNSKSVWKFSFQSDETVLIQNTNNEYRFLGYTASGDTYEAYSIDYLDFQPHAIKVYKLVEETTNLYIKTGNVDWNPYVWAWNDNGDVIIEPGHDSWFNKVQATELVEEHGITWHKITIPSSNFSFNLSDGQGDTGRKTEDIGPVANDTYVVYNSKDKDNVENYDYVIVDFADITAENIYLLPDETADNVVRNNNSAGVTLSYDNDNPSVATYNESTNQVTGLSHGTAIVTVSWPVTRTDDVHRGWVNGSTSFEVYVARSLELKEGEDNATAIGDNQNERLTVNLTRQLTADMWNAICLPFSMDASQMAALFGEGFRLRSFSGVEKDGANVTLKFAKATTLQAGVPYIVLPTKTVECDAVVVISDVTLTNKEPVEVEVDGYTFQGIYAPTSFKAGDKSIRFIGSGNKFYYPSNTNPMRAFRAYFTLPAGTTEAKVGMSFDEDMGVATGIVAVDGGAVDGRIYSMSGQYVGTSTQGLPRGLYIRDGRKFVVK